MGKRRRFDHKQTKFFIPQKLVREHIGKEVGLKLFAQYQEVFTCPYCLYTAKEVGFMQRSDTKKEFLKKRRCPDCNERMLEITLHKQMTVEEYARWLYQSIILSRGTYDRISWDKLKRRLKAGGVANRFWEAWKRAKKKDYDSEYDGYVRAERSENKNQLDG